MFGASGDRRSGESRAAVEFHSLVVSAQVSGANGQSTAMQELVLAASPSAVGGGRIMALDAVLIGWSRPGASTTERLPAQKDAGAGSYASAQSSSISIGARMPVLDARLVDALLGGAGMTDSLLNFDRGGRLVKRELSNSTV
jgi:hypothetical protein